MHPRGHCSADSDATHEPDSLAVDHYGVLIATPRGWNVEFNDDTLPQFTGRRIGRDRWKACGQSLATGIHQRATAAQGFGCVAVRPLFAALVVW